MLLELSNLIKDHQPVVALTGAGISTLSGIPAYRDRTGNWIQSKPIHGPEFRQKKCVRQRYWHRSMFGWPNFYKAAPNIAHDALSDLQKSGIVSAVITQNVDGLHQRAGSENVIELHGSLANVVCLRCGQHSSREELQTRLERQNSGFLTADFQPLADGDATVIGSSLAEDEFEIANCLECGGLLKPDVVFYGENVPAKRVEHCMHELDNAKALVCIGTSLAVLSGYRFCRTAHAAGKPIAIINQGSTRADDLAAVILQKDCGEALRSLCDDLS